MFQKANSNQAVLMDLERLHLRAVPFARLSDVAVALDDSSNQAEHYLMRAFGSGQPLAVITDPGGSTSTLLVQRFLSQVDDSVSVIRVHSDNRKDVLAAMQQIVRCIGFDPADLTLGDLESVLLLFLQHQRGNERRTIISFENVQEDEPWLLYYISRLLTLEADQEFGLMVAVAGQSEISQQLQFTMMRGDRVRTSEHFNLTPLKESGTLELLRQEIEACGAAEVGRVLAFEAVQRIHDLTGGAPDIIATLCQHALKLGSERGTVPVTAAVVEECAVSIGLCESPGEIVDMPARDWLVIKDSAPAPRNVSVLTDRAVIGRGSHCDIIVEDNWATREHALLLRTKRGLLIIDLLSTNGTFVNSKPIIRHCLQDKQTISIGTSELTYHTAKPEDLPPTSDEPVAEECEIPVLRQAVG